MMLVLTRRVGEQIFIGEDIVLEVRNISGDGRQVKLGIAAPRDVNIRRDDAKHVPERFRRQGRAL